jgi:hypothetical protein
MNKNFLFLFINIVLCSKIVSPSDVPKILLECPSEQEIESALKAIPNYSQKYSKTYTRYNAEIDLLEQFLDNQKYQNIDENHRNIKNILKKMHNSSEERMIKYLDDIDERFDKMRIKIQENEDEAKREKDQKEAKIKEEKNIKNSIQPKTNIQPEINNQPDNNNFKEEFIKLIDLLQDHSNHAKNLKSLVTQYSREDIIEQLKQENINYQVKLAKAEEFNIADVKELLTSNTIKTLKELDKEKDSLSFNKLIHLSEALFLLSTTSEQIQENRKLGLMLSKQYHPDKSEGDQRSGTVSRDIMKKNAEANPIKSPINNIINTETSLLLIKNKPSTGLDKLCTQIQGIIIPEPSFIKETASSIAMLITSIAAQTIGYDEFSDARPNAKSTTAELQYQCKGSMVGNILNLEQKLQNLKHKN